VWETRQRVAVMSTYISCDEDHISVLCVRDCWGFLEQKMQEAANDLKACYLCVGMPCLCIFYCITIQDLL
jgi:hypothetical protein